MCNMYKKQRYAKQKQLGYKKCKANHCKCNCLRYQPKSRSLIFIENPKNLMRLFTNPVTYIA